MRLPVLWLGMSLTFFLFASCGVSSLPSSQLYDGDVSEEDITVTEQILQAAIPAGIHGHTINQNSEIIYSDSFGNASPVRYLYSLREPYRQPRRIGVSGELPSGLEYYEDHYYVCDTSASTITRLNRDFEVVEQWSISQPWNLAISRSGRLIAVTYSGAAIELLDNGATNTLFDGLKGSFDAVFDGEEALWISEQGEPGRPGRVRLYSDEGDVLQELPGTWLNPEGLLLTSHGKLWVNDTEAGKVWRANVATEERQLIDDGYDLPISASQFPDGDILINAKGSRYLFVRFQEERVQ